MNRFLIVFSEIDKEKLIKKGFKYISKNGSSFIFENNGRIQLESDIVSLSTNKVFL